VSKTKYTKVMSRKKFIEFMKRLRKAEDIVDDLNKAFRKLDRDFNFLSLSLHSTLIVEVLREALHDTENEIEYFIYELDWGEKWKKGCVTDKDGNDIALKNLNDLYNFLVMNIKEEE